MKLLSLLLLSIASGVAQPSLDLPRPAPTAQRRVSERADVPRMGDGRRQLPAQACEPSQSDDIDRPATAESLDGSVLISQGVNRKLLRHQRRDHHSVAGGCLAPDERAV